MTTGRKLAIGGTVIVGVTAYMAYLGGAASWQYYMTVDECLAHVDRHAGARVRVSGRVAAGTLENATDPTRTRFSLTSSHDAGSELPVVYSGPLPDNMAEQIDVVVEGRLESAGLPCAENVLTRCASKYETGEHSTSDDRDLQTGAEAVR